MKTSLLLVAALSVSAQSVQASTYTLQPSSFLTLSDSTVISSTLTGVFSGTPFSSSGSGPVSEQFPGSMTTALTGTIDASVTGTTFSLASSSFTATNPLLGKAQYVQTTTPPFFPNIDLSTFFSLNGLAGNVAGSSTLVGVAGNQTFTFPTSGGTLAGTASARATGSAQGATTTSTLEFGSFSGSFGGSTGSLITSQGVETLTIPFSLSVLMDTSGTVLGFPFMASGNALFTGTLIAARPVPEPAAWGLMVSGLALVGAVARRRQSIQS